MGISFEGSDTFEQTGLIAVLVIFWNLEGLVQTSCSHFVPSAAYTALKITLKSIICNINYNLTLVYQVLCQWHMFRPAK